MAIYEKTWPLDVFLNPDCLYVYVLLDHSYIFMKEMPVGQIMENDASL
jgi:hypothetical protein